MSKLSYLYVLPQNMITIDEYEIQKSDINRLLIQHVWEQK